MHYILKYTAWTVETAIKMTLQGSTLTSILPSSTLLPRNRSLDLSHGQNGVIRHIPEPINYKDLVERH